MIRPLKSSEIPLLAEFLYQAIFLPPGVPAPDRAIIDLPELQLYIEDFGQKEGDLALVVEQAGQVVGSVWVRLMKDYGYLDDQTPSLSISLLPAYRGQGLGSQLMRAMFEELKARAYKQLSLSVSKDNPAAAWYRWLGFQLVEERETDYLMVYHLEDK
ncbi:GNAT family N-acetyltransferase [Streptococcus oricebi]|uniref:GNAT family N-acetyltransferase n=1 Tax=Streptococcus oricebi TaxID=1547447 RepID=A0ABS5B151_9STRE|nr:N-acetyltransferase [Streptococcus oricebi]MBP2622572.1 GNAT family N-acetyltransferase [Streptococcus oricebi]